MSKISIVTAFFDIGRGDWTPAVEKNGGPLPHYLERSVDKYLEHFKRMGEIDAEIVAFTSPDLVETLMKVVPKAKVIGYDYYNIHKNLRDEIEAIQNSPSFVSRINRYQVRNPEYWSKDYVGVTSLKAHFVHLAMKNGYVTNEWAAWMDFGYCRDEEHVPKTKKWEYDFTPDKMHYFNYRYPNKDTAREQIELAVLHNVVFIIGGVFVAQKPIWENLEGMMADALYNLMEEELVDDDQGLLLMAWFMKPDMFELHNMPVDAPLEDVRSILRKFNKYE